MTQSVPLKSRLHRNIM
nr:unnamed protein product [Callosobruchus chinensis]